MYKYTVEAMPGFKAKTVGDTSILYRIKRQDTSLAVGKKGRSEIIRTNLEYDEAVAQAKIFNDKEGSSRIMESQEGF